jgi:YD repeat-containing protein
MINKIPLTAINQSLSEYASVPDAKNVYTTVTYKRSDGTIYARSTLKNPDASNNYANLEIQYYDALGTTPLQKVTWTFTYDANGQITSKVVS